MEYSQICHTCRDVRPLSAFGWHVVTWYVTADKRKRVPAGANFGGPNRTCNDCWGAFKARQATTVDYADAAEYPHEGPARACPKCGDGRRVYLGEHTARCRACGWTYQHKLAS